MKKSEYDRILELKQTLQSNELRWENLAAQSDGFEAVITSILDPAHIFITPVAFLEKITNEKDFKRKQRIDVWDFMTNIIRNVQKSEDFFKIEQASSVDWNEMIRKRKLFAVLLHDFPETERKGTFYIRGRIISKMDNLKDGLIVLDIDSGTVLRVPLDAISYLPDSIVQIPPLCFPVSPAQLDFKPENWELTQQHMGMILQKFKSVVKIKQQDQEAFH